MVVNFPLAERSSLPWKRRTGIDAPSDSPRAVHSSGSSSLATGSSRATGRSSADFSSAPNNSIRTRSCNAALAALAVDDAAVEDKAAGHAPEFWLRRLRRGHEVSGAYR